MIKLVLKRLISLLSGIILFSTITCKHEPETLPDPIIPIDTVSGIPCNPDTSYFQNDVLPIFISSCAMSGCHDAASAQDGVVLISYQTVINTGDVRPGDPGNSDIFEKITDNDPEDRMPPPPMQALSPAQIEIIRKWIAQGAKNNQCDSGCDTTLFTFSGAILPIIDNNCKGCHSGATPSGNVNLDSYTALRTAAESGRLYGSVAHLSGYSPMPQGGKLSDCNITQIRKWIENGTPND